MNLYNSVFPLDKEKDYFSPPIPRGRSASSAPSLMWPSVPPLARASRGSAHLEK